MLRGALRAAEGRRRQDVLVDVDHLGIDSSAVATRDLSAAQSPVAHLVPPAAEPGPLAEAVDLYRKQLIQDAVLRSHGSWAEAARRLGMDRGNLHRLAHRLGIPHQQADGVSCGREPRGYEDVGNIDQHHVVRVAGQTPGQTTVVGDAGAQPAAPCFDVEARSHTQRQVLAQSFIGRHGIGVVSQRW